MKKDELIRAMAQQEFDFVLKRFASEVALHYKGLRIDPERFVVKVLFGDEGQALIKLLLDVATQNEFIEEHPADWWQSFKERWFPKYLKSKYPVRKEWTYAIHKFPEVDLPDEILGHEYVNLKVIDPWVLNEKLEI